MTEVTLLSPEVIEHFRQIYDQNQGIQWITGDYLADVIDELAPLFSTRLDDPNHYNSIHRAKASIIRQLANSVGCDTFTLYDREGMSRFFPQDVRQEYSALTYHQFRAIKSAGPDKWRAWADWAVENLPAPVALIRAKIKAEKQGHDDILWVSRWERIVILAEAIRNDEEAPQRVRQICGGILRTGVVLPTG